MPKKAALLINIGTPASPDVADIRRFLKEFLSDPLVFGLTAPMRFMLLNFYIMPFHSRRVAEAYAKIWTQEGEPLAVTSNKVLQLVQEKAGIPAAIAMRYGRPSIEETISQLAKTGVDQLFVMPLYPQYAASSFGSAVDKVEEAATRLAPDIHLDFLKPFYGDADYIDALAACAGPYLKDECDKLIFSFHSLPLSHLRKADPAHSHCLTRPDCCDVPHPAHAACYRHQCLVTANKFAEKLKLPSDKMIITYQSRMGFGQWLSPDTFGALRQLARAGNKQAVIICPSFVADCIETLEEIGIRGKRIFAESGGEALTIIPCLNDHPAWISFLANRINQWLESKP